MIIVAKTRVSETEMDRAIAELFQVLREVLELVSESTSQKSENQ